MLKQLFLLSFAFFLTITTSLTAQDEPDPNAQAVQTNETYAEAVYRISKMSREEKNTMVQCPLHFKGDMPMSDNYRANASDYTTCYEYPFAYQLNYRRFCKICTKIMSKESGDAAPVITKATFERCGVHNNGLKGNPDYDNVHYEKKPAADTPHAKQYLFKNYCTICTKIYKQQ